MIIYLNSLEYITKIVVFQFFQDKDEFKSINKKSKIWIRGKTKSIKNAYSLNQLQKCRFQWIIMSLKI